MGFYERWIAPRLLDLAMRNTSLDQYRQRTIGTARGLVLEVGVGSGLNLPLYGPAVTRVIGLDSSPELLRLASRRAADAVVPVSLLRASAEHVPFADAVFAIVLQTSIYRPDGKLAAMMIQTQMVLPQGSATPADEGSAEA
jgi:ubiquinone/menaquinone biosynthesis C-methylase UbiE